MGTSDDTVFLDTVGLLALWDEDDQWHDSAQTAFDRLLHEELNVVTSAFVLLECGNAAARRPYRETVCKDGLRNASLVCVLWQRL